MSALSTSPEAAADFVVLLTACIAPKAGAREGLHRADPLVRLKDYQDALKFWCNLSEPRIRGIVFADNSGFPLDGLIASIDRLKPHRCPVEFLSFDAPPPPPGMNYGHSEFLLVNEALKRSHLLATHTHFIKATGRYQFPDLPRLLKKLPDRFRIALDSKGLLPIHAKAKPMSQVALGLFERSFYESELAALPDQMVPAPPWEGRRHYIEFMLFDLLYPRRAEPGIILRWPCNCDPVGVGSNGDNQRAPKKRAIQQMRAITRVFFPALWI